MSDELNKDNPEINDDFSDGFDDFGEFDDFDDSDDGSMPTSSSDIDELLGNKKEGDIVTIDLADADAYDYRNHFRNLFLDKDDKFKKDFLEAIKNHMNPPNPDDRRTYKMRLYQAFNSLCEMTAQKMTAGDISVSERLLLRYMLLGENFLKEANVERLKEFRIDRIEYNEENNQPYFYADEWLEYVGKGIIRSSEGDDLTQLTGKKGDRKYDRYKSLQSGLLTDTKTLDANLKERQKYLDTITDLWKSLLAKKIGMDSFAGEVFEARIDNNSEINNIKVIMGKLEATNKFLNRHLDKLALTKRQLDDLKQQIQAESTGEDSAAPKLIETEWNQIKQMAKMCVGRTGNDFPFLTKQYFINDILTREELKRIMDRARFLDPELYYWKFQGIESHRCPYICIVPCYASKGICWEPIDLKNKVSGRGKIAVPLIPEDIPEKVVYATLGDFRWQKCKEAAGTYWMNEGLTAKYYMYHEELKKQKKRGIKVKNFIYDLKESFVRDYVMWMYFESQGIQKLSKEARSIMWNTLPFPDEVNDKLKDKGFVYKTLWENDQRKKKSGGY